MANIIGPNGKVHPADHLSPEAISELTAAGFRLETAEAPQTLFEKVREVAEEPLEAAAEGFGRGATFGLSDRGGGLSEDANVPFEERQALNKFAASERLKRKESNPVSSTVGEVAGMLVNPIGEAGTALRAGIGATSLLGRVGASAASGALEGAFFGAGNAVSEAALGDTELTAEKLLLGAGLGGVLGGAGGGVGHGLFEAGKAGVGKALKGAADLDLGQFANQRWMKATNSTGKYIKDIPLDEHQPVADVLRQHMGSTSKLDEALGTMGTERNQVLQDVLGQAGVTDAKKLTAEMGRDEALAALESMQKTEAGKFGKILQDADASGATFDYGKLESQLQRFEGGLNLAEEKIASRHIADIRELMEKAAAGPKGGFSGLNSIKSTLAEDAYRMADGNVTTRVKKQLSGILRNEIDTQLEPQIGAQLATEFQRGKKAFGILAQAEDALGRKASTGADAVGAIINDLKLGTAEAKKFGALTHAMNLTKSGMDRTLSNRWSSPTDYLTGIGVAAMTSNPMGVLYGLGTSLAHKAVRENGSRLIAKMADQFTKSPSLSAIATSFAQKAAAVPQQLGQYASRLAEAAAISPQHALATHMVMAQADPQYQLQANMAGFVPEDSVEHAGALQRGAGIASIAANVLDQDDDMEKHLEAIFKGGKAVPAVAGGKDFGGKRLRKNSKDAHDERIDEIMKVASDPAALLERVAGNLGNMANVAPGVAAALTQKANAAAQYLAGEAKRPMPAGPLAPPWKPTEAEKQSFSRKYHAVVDPMSVLKHAAAGTLTMDEMKALQAVYPRLARLASDQLLSKMAGHGKPVPYKARLMLSMVSGISADGTTKGEAIARNQAAISAPSRKQDAQGLGDGGKSQGDFKVANRMATPGQRREMRED